MVLSAELSGLRYALKPFLKTPRNLIRSAYLNIMLNWHHLLNKSFIIESLARFEAEIFGYLSSQTKLSVTRKSILASLEEENAFFDK